MKVGVSADWHIDYLKGGYTKDKVSSRIIDMDKQISAMVKICKQEKVELFVIAGDLFHRYTTEGYHLVRVIDYIRMFSDSGIKVIVLPGNHDMTESSSSITQPLERLRDDGITVVNKLSLYEDLLVIPHERKDVFKDYKSYTDFLKARLTTTEKEDVINLIVGHFQPKWSIPGSEESMFSGSTRYVDMRIFDRFDCPVISGHVHNPQDKGKQYVVGSPVRFDMGERNDKKRFLVTETESGKVESFELKCQRMSRLSIDLVDKNSYSLPKDKLIKYKGHIVKVLINTTKVNKPKISIQEIRRALESVGAYVTGIDTKTIQTDSDKIRGKLSISNMSPTKVFLRVLNREVKNKEENARLKKIGNETIGESR